MFRKLWVAIGLQFPSVADAMRTKQACTRINYNDYCVKSRAGFAEAFSDHIYQHRNNSTPTLALYSCLHEGVLARANELQYPCVVFFSEDSFTSLPIDKE